MRKIISFIRENKIISLVFAIIVLSLILLAIPGFAKFGLKGKDTYTYTANGYSLFFGGVESIVPDADNVGSTVGAGIAAFVMLVIGAVAVCFSKKSSFVMLLTSLELITVAILFFAMKKPVDESYALFSIVEDGMVLGFLNYFIASIVMIAGLLLGYKTVMIMKDEIKHPSAKSSSGPTYSYLKK